MNDDFVHIDSIAININNQNPEQVTDELKHEGLRWLVFACSFFHSAANPNETAISNLT